MGNVSYLTDYDITFNCATKPFVERLLCYILNTSYYKTKTASAIVKKLIDKFEIDVNKIKPDCCALSFLKNIDIQWEGYMSCIEIDHTDYNDEHHQIYFDINEHKIQGYWYDEFCLFLYILWDCGVRGYIKMNEEQNQDFEIRFENDNIYVDFYPTYGYYETDEEYEEALEKQPNDIVEIIRLDEITKYKFNFFDNLYFYNKNNNGVR